MSRPYRATRGERRSGTVVVAIISVWFLSGLMLIPRFGFHYDEVLFINAATDGLKSINDNLFIRRRLFGVPMLLMDYIGALKAWLYVPIFAAFDPSVWSVRIPTLVFGAGGIWVSTRSIRGEHAGFLRSALALVLAAAVTPTLLLIFDVGPVAIAFLMQSIMLTVLVRSVRIQSERRLPFFFVGILLSFLSVFNKLDSLIFVLPYLVILTSFCRKPLFDFWSRRPYTSVILCLILAVPASLMLSYMLIPSRKVVGGGQIGLADQFWDTLDHLKDFVSGGAFSQFIDTQPKQGPWVSFLLIFSLAPAFVRGSTKMLRGHRRGSAEVHAKQVDAADATCLLLIGVFITYALTESAQRPWHTMAFWPLLPVGAALGVQATFDARRAFRRDLPPFRIRLSNVLLLATFAAGLFSVVSGAQALVRYRIASDTEPLSLFWSDTSKEIASELSIFATTDRSHIVAYTSHWGVGTQVKAHLAHNDNVTLIDSWPWFSGESLETMTANLQWTSDNWASPVGEPQRAILIEVTAKESAVLSPQPLAVQLSSTEAAREARSWCNSTAVPLQDFGEVLLWDLPCLDR
jgi:hypothetical protein